MPISARKPPSLRSEDRSPAEAKRTRKRPSHILGAGEQSLKHRKQAHAYPLRREDVRIQIGSQEKRPGESSSVAVSKSAHSVPESHTKTSRTARQPLSGISKGNPALDRSQLRREIPRSSLPMRETPSDQSERDDGGCCISSDAQGRILVTSFPPLAIPVSTRPIPGWFYQFEGADSDNTGTAIGQIGRAPSPVPSSQRVENGRWRNWLGQPSSVISSHVAVEGSRASLEHRVSPGISEIRRPERTPPQHLPPPTEGFMRSKPDEIIPNDSRDPDKLPSSDNSSDVLCRYEELVSRLRRPEQFIAPKDSLPLTEEHVEMNAEATMPSESSEPYEEGLMPVSGAYIHEEDNVPPDVLDTQNQEIVAASHVEISQAESMTIDHLSPLPLLATQPGLPASEGTDPEEAWKTFVFGDEDSDEVGKAVFEEARHDAARMIQPSDSSAPIEDDPESEPYSNIATVGTLYANDSVSTSELTESPPPTRASAEATYDHSSDRREEGSTLDNSEVSAGPPSVEVQAGSSEISVGSSETSAGAPSVEVNAATSIASGVETSTDRSDSSGPRSGGIAESSTSESRTGPPSMTTSMAVVPARSDVGASEAGTSGEPFRFVPPRLFVGSRSNDVSQLKRGTESGVGISLTKRRRGRQRKRADDGRADIRALPNYSSDPIEEVEDAKRPSKSRFPALELT